ncbi:response regulator [Gordoniibacillus kamchatkensis]|uniref:response regulator n=1 Tax=Gordoniibacillus kamchatkensis TaxID=1590651 RepID=UPI0018CDEC84|nr:response regulator [Paenibacillus sp. VKM B-2647]
MGIKSVIDWEAHGFHYAGDAADGKQALELIEQSPPDILLTDIIMPNMDGLELIQIVKNKYPWIRIIVLSSHDQYDYVRKAMKMGVDDYILKASIEPEQLLDLLQETSNKIVSDRPAAEPVKTQGHSLAQIVRNRLEGGPPLELEQGGVPKGGLTAAQRLLLVRVHGGPHFHADDPSAMPTLLNLIELQLKKWTEGHALHYKDQDIVLLIPSDGELTTAPDALQALGRDLISAAKRFWKHRSASASVLSLPV